MTYPAFDAGSIAAFNFGDQILNPGPPAQAYVATSESTTSTSYADLATTTDTVTVTIGSSGMAQVSIYGQCSGSSFWGWMSYAISGANTSVAADGKSLDFIENPSSVTGWGGSNSLTLLETGLAPGSTTFKLKYKSQNSGASQTFSNRRIAVIPL